MAVELNANPYPGLRPFETEEDYLFFGRDGQSEEILSRLRRNRFVAVVGTSGSGKSSLIRAGLLPYVYGGFMAGAGSHWRVAVMRPGGDPIRNLAKALYDPAVLAVPGKSEEEATEEATVLEVTLRRSGLGLIEAVRQAQLPETDNVLIVVDQFEELFRFAEPSLSTRNEDDAAAFVKLLLEAVAQTGLSIYVVLTMRSDFIGDCARYRDLPEAIAAGLYLIPRMTRDQRREAIERPARVAESQISPRLMNRLLNDGGDNPDQLPILQHALMRTWDYWRRHRDPDTQVDLEDYKAIGEMEEALSIHAEEAYAELPDERSRMIAKRMFQALTEKGEDNREIRRPTSVATIAATAAASVSEVIAVIEYFRQPGRSFLTPPATVPLTEGSVIDISHESLIRGWVRLNRWVDEETESTKVYLRLAETAELEAAHKANLWRGSDLSTALAWRQKENPTQEWGHFYHPGFETAMRFLDRSAAARRQAIAGVSAMAVLAVAGCLLLFYTHEHNAREKAAVQSALLAQQQKAANDARLALADHEKQEALIERDQAGQKQAEILAEQNEQETEWVRQLARSANVEGINTNSQVNILGSSLIDAESPDLRVDTQDYRGEALSKMGEHEKAAQAYSNALLLHPEQYGPLGSRAYEYILMGRAEDALADLKILLQHDPHSFSSQLNRAVALGMLKRYPEAEADVEHAISDFQITTGGMFDSEASPDIKRATGQSMVMANAVTFRVALYYEAASLKAFAGDPGFLASLDRADRFAQQEGFYSMTGNKPAKSSVDPFVEAIEWAWLSARAQGIASKGNDADYGVYAVYGALWERAGRIQPRFTGWAGHFYQVFEQSYDKRKQRRYERMNAWANSRMRTLYPATGTPPSIASETSADAGVLADDASVLESRSNYEGAAAKLSEAIQMIGNKPEERSELVMLLLRRAHMYIKAKKWNLAGADSKRVLQYAPNTAEAFLYLGMSEADNDAEIRDFGRAEQLNPASWSAKYYLANALEQKDPKRALALFKEANRVSVGSSVVYREMAKLQNAKAEYREALASINAAIAIDPTDAESYEIRDKAEDGLGVGATERAIDAAASARLQGDYLARAGQNDEALHTELQGLRQLATSTAGKSNDNVLAEEAVSAYSISQLLQRMGSRQDAKQFWGNIRTSDYFSSIRDIAQHEEDRLSNP